MLAIPASLTLASFLAAPAASQSPPGSFTLPEPTPTPSSAPQGPVDIREGVVIGPRTIREPTPAPSPSVSPAPSPSASIAPEPTLSETSPAASPNRSDSARPDRPTGSDTAPIAGRTPPQTQEDGSEGESAVAEEANDAPAPGFSDEGWYSTDRATGVESEEERPANTGNLDVMSGSDSMFDLADVRFQAVLGLVLIFLACLAGWLIWRRRKTPIAAPKTMAAPTLAAGVRSSMPEPHESALTNPPKGNAKPKVAPASAQGHSSGVASPSPVTVAIQLDVAGAARSLMMFSIDYRLSIANRSDQALRDLAISARLVCARGAAAKAPMGGDEPLELVERIGPHQSRSLSGTLQLPLREVNPMRQGATPVFIPLLEIRIEAAGRPSKTYRYVIGAPSAASASRLHPIALDTAPGGIVGLRAQEIKEAPVRQSA
ncbi:hypothetical protein ACI5KX_12530 [Erythrobacter sp. GH1-10]|uniref:hypothetical protein n=1 Tax=Erythrobacter sp. GH1-10 TaxID=3349334 RepID=UPI003877C378